MTHIETDTAARLPRAARAAAGQPLRRPARAPQVQRRSNPSVSAGAACPVAALAEEAAAVIRLKRALRQENPGHDAELVDALEGPDDGVRPGEMADALFDRLRAIADLASHRRAESLKGALFQLYLVASIAPNPAGLIVARLSPADTRALEENDRKVNRLHYAAIAHLEALALDDDLVVVRSWYFTVDYDVHRTCDRAFLERDGLVADAKARTAATRRDAAAIDQERRAGRRSAQHAGRQTDADCKPCRKSAARCACAAAVKMKRLSSCSTCSQFSM